MLYVDFQWWLICNLRPGQKPWGSTPYEMIMKSQLFPVSLCLFGKSKHVLKVFKIIQNTVCERQGKTMAKTINFKRNTTILYHMMPFSYLHLTSAIFKIYVSILSHSRNRDFE